MTSEPTYTTVAVDPITFARGRLLDLLDKGKHDDECVLRCLRNDCEADHGCAMCADEDEDGPPPDLNPEGDPTLNGAFG